MSSWSGGCSSPGAGVTDSPGGTCAAAAASRRRRALIAAQLVGQPPRGDRDQPAARVVRHALARPLDGGGQQRLLDGVLAGVELAVAPDERAEDLRRQLAQQVLDVVVGSHISTSDGFGSGQAPTPTGSPDARIPRNALSPAISAPGLLIVAAGSVHFMSSPFTVRCPVVGIPGVGRSEWPGLYIRRETPTDVRRPVRTHGDAGVRHEEGPAVSSETSGAPSCPDAAGPRGCHADRRNRVNPSS